MEKFLRYNGEFLSQAGVCWRVEIWQDAPENYPAVGRLVFPADDPLVIEWNEVDKLEPVQASKATLTLVSKVDRQYKDLYTVEVGSIRMDVYRADALYWSGTLDTELYEEPFAYEKEYEVTLTFGDFAVLDRIKYTQSGFRTLYDLMCECMEATQIKWLEVNRYLSTQRADVPEADLLYCTSISSANFYDEDGAAMTMREVLEETLRPFGAHVVQRAGRIHLYDLNALRTTFEPKTICWEGTDAVLGVDKVYNNVVVTFSPYLKSNLLDFDFDASSLEAEQENILWKTNYGEGATDGFRLTLFKNKPMPNDLKIHQDARLYEIKSIFSGDDHQGLAWRILKWPYNAVSPAENADPADVVLDNKMIRCGETLMDISYPIELATSADTTDVIQKECLLLSMDLLIDGRYNPYEQANEHNAEINQKVSEVPLGLSFGIPFKLWITDEKGKSLWHYSNARQVLDTWFPLSPGQWTEGDYKPYIPSFPLPGGGWTSDHEDFSMLFYYDRNGSVAGYPGGWMTNYQNLTDRAGNEMYNRIPGGELIPIPPGVSGRIKLEIMRGWKAVRRETNSPSGHRWGINFNMHPMDVRGTAWVLYKMPHLELVDKYGKQVKGNDLKYEGWLMDGAKEVLEIDTCLGTGGGKVNRGNGLLLDSGTRLPVDQFIRAGVTDYLEKLLVNTIYSNYGRRMNVLTGTTSLLLGFDSYTDTNEPGHYLMVSDVQHVIRDESEMKIVEFEQDIYINHEKRI